MHESYVDAEYIYQAHVWTLVLSLLKFCGIYYSAAPVHNCRDAFPL